MNVRSCPNKSDLIPLAILDSWKRVPIGDRAPVGPLASLSFEELAAQQGVAPVENFEALLGGPSAEDESVEEFYAMLRAWCRCFSREIQGCFLFASILLAACSESHS